MAIELESNLSQAIDLYTDTTQSTFTAGVATWQVKNRLGSLKFDGKFDDSARFTKGKAYLATPTAIGSLDLTVNLSDRIKPMKTITGWQANTPLGSLAIKGNFDEKNRLLWW